ncbi:MAG: hypothetical protein E3K36_14665 [Candidatus Brocadia sp.]|nr:hypothetical protein [Candidatus Brocadia sp.]
MSLEDLINNNQTAFLTFIGTISGVGITQAANLFFRWIDHRNNLKIKRLDLAIELEKKYLIDPVVSFIDKDLKSMQKTYALVFNSKEGRPNFDLDKEHVFVLSSIQARIKGLGDSHLSEKFEEFSRARVGIGTAVSDAEVNAAYKKLDGAIKLAGEILELLFKKLRKIEK